jgi:beta-1,4-mannosyl-glycoprotein beta-1,4-N-acetylglucosaminyltransferase
MIIDCFPFFDELDLLEIRLHELADIVDVFVLVESPYTFTGIEKPLHYLNNSERFSGFNIVHHVFYPCKYYKPLEYERHQKQHGLNAVFTLARPGDVVIVGDVDEIPRAAVVEQALNDEWCSAGLVMSVFYYFMNCQLVSEKTRWDNRLIRYEGPFRYNMKQNDQVDVHYYDAGWHFSFLGDVRDKLRAWGHAEQYDKPPYNRPVHIEKCKREGLDLFMRRGRREKKFEFVDDLGFLPEFVKNNMDKFDRYLR